jgi:hypothetical protein
MAVFPTWYDAPLRAAHRRTRASRDFRLITAASLGRLAGSAARVTALAGRVLGVVWAVLVLGLLLLTASGFWAG